MSLVSTGAHRDAAPADDGRRHHGLLHGRPRRRHRKPTTRRFPRRVVWAAVLVVVLTAAGGVWAVRRAEQMDRPPVVVTVPYWSLDTGLAAASRHADTLTTVSPWTYELDPTGRIVPAAPVDDAAGAALAHLRDRGVAIMPGLANVTGGRWRRDLVAERIHDPARRRAHVTELVDLVVRNDYDGLELDYEELQAEDRDAFSSFVAELAEGLHAHDRRLAVDVFAKADDAGYGPRNAAQDYAAIGRAADQVRLMAYDYHWSTSEPGPVAPRDWVSDVLRYATSHIPTDRLLLGLPQYGYDWTPTGATGSGWSGRPVSWVDARRTAATAGAEVAWDAVAGASHYSYRDPQGVQHTVWFEDAVSTAGKLNAAHAHGVGTFLWLYGPTDPGVWTSLGGDWDAPAPAPATGHVVPPTSTESAPGSPTAPASQASPTAPTSSDGTLTNGTTP